MEAAFAERYAALQRTHWWFRGRRRVLDAILDRELPRPVGRMLVVGCGPAEGLEWLARRGTLVALDVEPSFAKGAERGAFLRASATDLPFAPQSFDLIIALDVIEHLDDDAGALREMARVARPGAALLCTVPALPSLWGPHDVINQHRRRYTRAALRDAFARGGITPTWVRYFNSLLLPPIALVRWSRRLRSADGEPRSDFDDPQPRFLSGALESILSLESHLVGRVPFPAGVSLVALARL